ncbi:hypothetical protein Tco_0024565 [Tanacetum coccineum]
MSGDGYARLGYPFAKEESKKELGFTCGKLGFSPIFQAKGLYNKRLRTIQTWAHRHVDGHHHRIPWPSPEEPGEGNTPQLFTYLMYRSRCTRRYIPESDPERDPEEDDEEDPTKDPADYPADRDDDDDEEEDEEEEEHLAPADFTVVAYRC